METTSQQQFSLIEFFAGIGGARIALAPDFIAAYANDASPLKAEVFRKNHPGVPLDTRSIADVAAADLPAAELVWASFPCVDHSLQGRRSGFAEGARGSLVFQVMRTLAELNTLGRKPPVVCFENVSAFVSHEGGRDFGRVAQALASLGYAFGALVVDAKWWLPVLRDRVFIVAVDARVAVAESLLCSRPMKPWHTDAIEKAVETLPTQTRKSWRWWTLPMPVETPPTLESLLDPVECWLDTERASAHLARCHQSHVDELHQRREHGPVLAVVAAQRSVSGPTPERKYGLRMDGMVRCLTAGSAHQFLIRADEAGVRMREFSKAELARLAGFPTSVVMPDRLSQARVVTGEGLAIPAVHWLGKHLLTPLAQASAAGEVRQAAPVRKRVERVRRDGDSVARRGIKALSAMTLYLYPEELARLHEVAANDGMPATEWIYRSVDGSLLLRG